ncbi:MAG: tetraacyldisaccharide 4'-kinase [Nitrospirota bacterium]
MRVLLTGLAVPYGLAVRARALLYRVGWLPSRRLPRPVVSVGNLTVGGTGKTPIVIWIAQRLTAQGMAVAVLSRGYRRRTRGSFLLVSDGDTVLAGPADAGDEPYLIAQRCPGAVVAVGADRYRLGRWLLERSPRTIDCFVLDDGFQHLALCRDVDLLLVDATDADGLAGLLPAGRLREPLTAARRATAVLITRAESRAACETMARTIEAAGVSGQPIFVRFRPDGIVPVGGGSAQEAEVVAGRKALAFSGIANPRSFHETLAGLGVTLVDSLVFPDHHWYRAAELEEIRQRAARGGAELVLTTEKDAGKVAPLLKPDDRFLAVRLGAEILRGQDRLERLLFSVTGDR